MEKQSFQKGMAVLYSVFPKIEIDGEVFWALLSDLKDGDLFLLSVVDIAKNLKEVFPGTNLVALIRAGYFRIYSENCMNKNRYVLPDNIERWGTPSKEFKDLVQKLADGK